MYLYVVLIVALAAHVNSEDFDDRCGVHFYKQLNCTAVGQQQYNPCPLRYDCPKYEIPKGKCRFYNDLLDPGQIADGSYCNRGCSCTATEQTKGSFNCGLVIDCRYADLKPGCYWARKELRQCCPEMVCPPFQSNFTCKFGDEEYRDGEFFSPRNTCWNCHCKRGFTGKLEPPFCIPRPCDLDLRYSEQLEKKCIPVYRATSGDQSLCCPFDFICSDQVKEMEVVEHGRNTSEKCEFAGVKYNLNEIIIPSYTQNAGHLRKAYCHCTVPPYLKCTSA